MDSLAPGDARRIVVATEGGPHVWGIVNALTAAFGPVTVVLETPTGKWPFLKARARRLGWVQAAGQLGTMLVIRAMKTLRPDATTMRGDLDLSPPAEDQIIRVASVNDPAVPEALAKLDAHVVLLVGCRMLTSQTLDAIACPILNYHSGITPLYRGTNGGYWALADGDAGNFGTTVHLVDKGVDTGVVLYQTRGEPHQGDTIATYPLTQAAFSRDICIRAISDTLAGKLNPVDPGLPSVQRYHPTIWRYVWTGLRRGVW